MSWWKRRSLRTRLVVLSIVPLTAALLVGTVTLVVLFTAGRTHDLDRQTHQETAALLGLVTTDQMTSPLPVPPGSALLAQVINSSGSVLASSPSASLVLPLVQPDTASSRSRDFTDEDNPYGAVPLRLHEQTVMLGTQTVVIVVAAPLADVRRALQSLKIVLFLLVPALVALASILEWTVIGSALRPVERLRTAAATLADETHPVHQSDTASPRTQDPIMPLLPVGSGDDEIARLGRTFNKLLSQLYRSIIRERIFLADAAHELRSPLTNLRVQLDVAETHPGLVSTTELVADMTAEVQRLTQLTDDLLLLGRLQARVPTRRSPVNLTELAGAQGPTVHVLGDSDDLKTLIRNLTDNARRHANNVDISVDENGGFAVLNVDDDGPGISPADRTRAFDRWTRLDDARDRRTGGSGLGLALVREIAQAHQGQAEIHDSPLGGTRVQLRLPAITAPDDPTPERPS